MREPSWVPGSFLDNLDAAALRLGYQHLPIAWGLAKVDWPSTSERDAFLDALTRPKDKVTG
jgi:hypothetical protein